MAPSPITCCRVCGNPHLIDVLQLGDQCLTGVFPASPDQPVLSGPLDLVRCSPDSPECCGLLQLRHSYPAEAMYGENYGYRSGLNASMVRHLEAKAAGLATFAQLRPGDVVLDIGCNDGTLLKAFPSSCRRIGMDPVAKKHLHRYPDGIEVVTDFFSAREFEARLGTARARIITSIAMFYDLENPVGFVREIAACLADDGVWHFEQSYMPTMLSQLAYDTICHEHIEYYALRQIVWILEHAGLEIVRLEPSLVNGGSLAVTAAKKGHPFPSAKTEVAALLAAEVESGLETMRPFEEFAARVEEHRTALRATREALHSEGLKVLGYGASTKGNVLLQFCGFTPEELPAIGEVNEEKFGRFTPGTRIPIVSESEMHAMEPDVLLVLPWHFRDNLIEREAAFLARGGRLLFPLPAIEFVSR